MDTNLVKLTLVAGRLYMFTNMVVHVHLF